MRVLQILPELNVGGVETGTVDFAKYLKEKGHHSVVVSHGGPLVQELSIAGVTHYTLPVHKKSFFTAWNCVKSLRDIIVTEKIDIVHARSRVPAWIAFFACRKTPAEFLTTCHGYYSKHFFSEIMGWSKLIIVPSQVIGRHMVDDFKVAAENIRCIPRSVDLQRFNIPRDDKGNKASPVISIVGRITPLKGHTYFLKAMAQVLRKLPQAKIWIIGDVPVGKENYREELQVLARRLGIYDSVEFLGTRKDVPQLLAKTDVLVMSTIVPEAFGRVILEAQAVGVPVVATSVGGVVEIIDHEQTGLLVMPKDSDAMAEATLRILGDKKLAQKFVAAARLKIENKFLLRHMADSTIKVYEELLKSLRILVIKISSVGDVILITASLKAFRQRFPTARICVLVGEASRKVLQRCPYIDELVVVDFKTRDRGMKRLWQIGRKLLQYKFDKIVDLQNNNRSHLLAFLSFPKESYGFKRGRLGFLLTHGVKDVANNLSPVEHQYQILGQLGMAYTKDNLLELWPSEKENQSAKKLLESEWVGGSPNIVGINIAASGRWGTKNWPVEYIARLCDILAVKNIRVIVTGLDKDRDLAKQLTTLTKTKPAILIGKTDLMELAAVIKTCRVFISPDSAPLHIAAAMKVPVIALFGPTSSQRHMPPAKTAVIFEKKPPCAPCYGTSCKVKTRLCMRDITPEEVAQQIYQLMN
ncbi:MAG: lipopolysaccharide heptosyltransferase II [Candidatus Omnitrophica bacterium]|nr:lipopolysaccharide heptosyltransferase II [Candidatus Omnitrophota bacterium]